MTAGSRGRSALIEIVVVIAIVVFANLLSLKFFARADLTEGRLFSVSESTRRVLGDLDDIVNIKVYFSKRLPPYLTTLTREIGDMLDEYRAYAGGNLVIDFEDPADDPEIEKRAQSLGVPPVQLNVVEKDKIEAMAAYLGIAILFEDRSEAIPVVQNVVNLEYDLTSAIIKVASSDQKTVGFLAGHDEPDLEEDYDLIGRTLEKQYSVEPVLIENGRMIPDDINTLVVAGPDQLSDWALFAIDQYIMRGGRTVFLADKFGIAQGSMNAIRKESNLEPLLEHYGVYVKYDMVVDRSCASATFSSGYFRYTVPYVLWPMVGRAGLDRTSPITNQLETVVMPWTSSLEIIQAEGDTLNITVLAKSSERSWSEERGFNLNPQRDYTPTTDVRPRILAVLVSGEFASFFADKAYPPAGEAAEGWSGLKLEQSPMNQIVVVGNSRFIGGDFLGQFPENAAFFLNAVDLLTLGESLIGIRSRAVTTRPLKMMGEKSKATMKFVVTFGIPVALIVWGLLRRYLRSSRRRELPV